MWRRVGPVLLVVGVLLTGCASLTKLLLDPSAGQVRAFEGQVLVLRPGTSQPQRLDLESPVFAKDIVRTLEHSRCRIALQDGTLLTLGERSELEMQRSAPSRVRPAPRFVLKLVTGLRRIAGLAVPVASTASEVLTTLASFTFSPTTAIIEVTPTRVSALSLEGTVRVVRLQEGLPGEVVLQSGEGTDIAPGHAATPPRPWAAVRVERVTQATDLP